MPSLALLVHRVADLDEGGLLLVVAEAIGRHISKDDFPDPLRLQVVVDLDGNVSDAGPRVEQDGGDVGLLIREGSHLQPGLEIVHQMLGKSVAHNYEAVVCVGVAVSEGRKGEAGDSYFGDLMAERGDVI